MNGALRLPRLSLDGARGAPARLFDWWLREWSESLPLSARNRAITRRAARLVIRFNDEAVLIESINRDGTVVWLKRAGWSDFSRRLIDTGLAELSAHGARPRIHLVLTNADIISHAMPVPEQAHFRAEAIVREHVRRKTPLKLDDVLIGCDIRTSPSGHSEIRYIVLQQKTLDRILSRLTLSRSELAVIEGPSRDGHPPIAISIQPIQDAPAGQAGRVAAKSIAAIAAAGLLSMAIVAWQQHQTLNELTGRLDAVATPAKELSGQLRQFQETVQVMDSLKKLRNSPSVVHIWEALAELLPDSTWLTELQVAGDSVSIAGFSSSTTDLIPLLSQSNVFSGASLSAPIVIDPAKGKERFVLRVKLRTPRLQLESGH